MGGGKKLQEVLKERNISIAQLARDAKISSNTLYALIKRDSNINASTMSKISDVLGISVGELSELLSDKDENMKTEQIKKSRILDEEITETLSDTKEIVQKLNRLTMEYEVSIEQLRRLKREREERDRIVKMEQHKISVLDEQLSILENDVKNRQMELSLIRSKLGVLIQQTT